MERNRDRDGKVLSGRAREKMRKGAARQTDVFHKNWEWAVMWCWKQRREAGHQEQTMSTCTWAQTSGLEAVTLLRMFGCWTYFSRRKITLWMNEEAVRPTETINHTWGSIWQTQITQVAVEAGVCICVLEPHLLGVRFDTVRTIPEVTHTCEMTCPRRWPTQTTVT